MTITAPRHGQEAIAWGRAQITHPTPGRVVTGATSWFRLCKAFARGCCAIPSDGTLNAGAAWDNADLRHREDDPSKIPAAVFVFWELPSVEDHVAFTTGGGRCLSNDILRKGQIDEVPIDLITREWGGILLGWSEDIDGKRAWEPPTPPPPVEPDPTRVRLARQDVWRAIGRLDAALEAGRGERVQLFRDSLRRDLRRAPKR